MRSQDQTGPSTTEAKQQLGLSRLENQQKTVASLTDVSTRLNQPLPKAAPIRMPKRSSGPVKVKVPAGLSRFDRRDAGEFVPTTE